MGIKVVILCGGFGTRLREETELKPKPMIEIGDMPILWHIMKTYAHYGFNEFILCLGYKGKVIKNYFYNYGILSSNFTIELGSKNIKMYSKLPEIGWKITLVDTGVKAMTGARIKRIERFINSDTFMLTYGDGVAAINIRELLKFHKSHGKIGTITGVNPSSRFGELLITGNQVKKFSEKPQVKEGFVNGGFFVFDTRVFRYLKDDDDCAFEKQPLQDLTLDEELMIYKHEGFWQCMDTYRDYKYLNDLWKRGNVPWKVW